jgi:hypothetical protein
MIQDVYPRIPLTLINTILLLSGLWCSVTKVQYVKFRLRKSMNTYFLMRAPVLFYYYSIYFSLRVQLRN